MPITLRGPDGQIATADESTLQSWLDSGYHPTSEAAIANEAATDAMRPEDRGLAGDINAAVASALSGATLGGSDWLASKLLSRGSLRQLQGDIEHAPVVSTVARIGGELAPAFLSGGESLLAKTPAAALGRLSAEAGEVVGGTGLVSRVGRLAATGAVEGGISNAGQYLGSVALQDKDASAEGFLASLQDGALYGAGAAGALGLAGEGLIAARRLLPEAELTPVAVRRARDVARQEISAAVDDAAELDLRAQQRARLYREKAIEANPALRQELDQIALTKEREIAAAETRAAQARASKAESDAAAARSRADAAETRAQKAKEPRAGRTRKAFEEPTAKTPTEVPASAPETAGTDVPASAAGSAASDVDSDLMRQLQGTKAALDTGVKINQISAPERQRIIEAAQNARVAKESPEMERLLRHLDSVSDARQRTALWLQSHPGGKVRAFEYAEGMRKQSGWRDVLPMDSQRPGFTEGGFGAPRGRQGEFIGDEAARLAFESKVNRGDLHRIIDDPLTTVEEAAAAKHALDLAGPEQAAALANLQAKRAARQIVNSGTADVDRQIEQALTGHADLTDEVEGAAEAIGSLEQTSADLADELGIDAPARSQERARQFRESQRSSEASNESAAQAALMDADRAAKTIGLGETPQARKAGGILQAADKLGQFAEVMHMMGIPIDTKQIPVVGPLLSLYLKAKVGSRFLRGLGGKVARTAETEIAGRAASVKDKVVRAADRALGLAGSAATSTTGARTVSATAAAVLSAKLFDDRDPTTKEKRTTAKDNLQDIYLARSEEVMRAMAPGAIEDAVRRRVQTTDSELLASIVATEKRRLSFLYSKMPKVGEPQIFGNRMQPVPARADIERWSKYVSAANDPVSTLEGILDGEITSAEANETLRTVYPRLLEQAQRRILERAAEGKADLPYKKSVHLSMALSLPLDRSQGAEMASFLAQAYSANTQAMGAAASGGPSAPMPRVGMAQRIDPQTKEM